MSSAVLKVSVIATVLNEGTAIRRLMDSLVNQTRPPDEVVIADGGSSDETLTILEEYTERLPLRILIEPTANISRGRNVAIAAAAGPVIASTDVGVWLEPDWLASLVAPFERTTPEQWGRLVASGFFVPDPTTTFELAMGATVLPVVDEVDSSQFLPSSRSVAFGRDAWAAVGGYPEWLDYCEDLVFDLRLKALGCQFVWTPEAVVHFRPRSTLASYFKQYYCYARGDGKADLWRCRHAIRYAVYLAGLLLLLATRRTRLAWLPLVVGGAGYCSRPVRHLLLIAPPEPTSRLLAALALVPIIRLVGDIAKMIGYPAGCWWRRQHRPPEWRTV